MSYGLVRARYADEAAQTASPARLLTMLYDRLVSDLAGAEDAMRRGDIEGTGERVGRAQEILLELCASLDTSVWPDGVALSRLYLWMVPQLMTARLRLQPDKIAECRHLLEPLCDAWRSAAVESASEPAASPAQATATDAVPAAAGAA
jgi:flagellar secretion chaperone FliS